MNSKYLHFGFPVKSIAFIPSLAVFVLFGLLIWFHGREGQGLVEETVVTDGASVHGVVIETLPVEERDIAFDGNHGDSSDNGGVPGNEKTDEEKNSSREMKTKSTTSHEVAGEEDDSVPKLLYVQEVTSVWKTRHERKLYFEHVTF